MWKEGNITLKRLILQAVQDYKILGFVWLVVFFFLNKYTLDFRSLKNLFQAHLKPYQT